MLPTIPALALTVIFSNKLDIFCQPYESSCLDHLLDRQTYLHIKVYLDAGVRTQGGSLYVPPEHNKIKGVAQESNSSLVLEVSSSTY